MSLVSLEFHNTHLKYEFCAIEVLDQTPAYWMGRGGNVYYFGAELHEGTACQTNDTAEFDAVRGTNQPFLNFSSCIKFIIFILAFSV